MNTKQRNLLNEEKKELEKNTSGNTIILIICFISAMYGILSREYFWLILGIIGGIVARSRNEKSKDRIKKIEYKLANNN